MAMETFYTTCQGSEVQEDSAVYQSSGVYTMRLFVMLTSILLVIFYCIQLRFGRCSPYPIYVQIVTAIVYTLSALGYGGFVISGVVMNDGAVLYISIARYLFWITTCPVILAGFIQMLHFNGDAVNYDRATFIIVKDLLCMCFGILSGISVSSAMRIAFCAMAFAVSGWLLIDLGMWVRDRSYFFEGYLNTWLTLISMWLLLSWMIFPILWVLGPPGFGVITQDQDFIAHALGDLLAKNMFGFAAWYMRWYVIEVYLKETKENAAPEDKYQLSSVVVPMTVSGKRDPMLMARHMQQKVGSLIVIEPESHLQRLLLYVMKDANVEVTFAFSLDQARRTLLRDRLDTYHGIWINVATCEDCNYKEIFAQDPFCLPVVGYAFDPAALADPATQDFCNTHITHVLDPQHCADVVKHWRKTCDLWRERARSQREEQKLAAPRSPNRPSQDSFAQYSTGNNPADDYFDQSPTHFTRRRSSSGGHQSLMNDAYSMGRATSFERRPSSAGREHQQSDRIPSSPNSLGRRSTSNLVSENVPSSTIIERCSNAGCLREAQMQCGACHKTKYCSRDCQVSHWRAGHKAECCK